MEFEKVLWWIEHASIPILALSLIIFVPLIIFKDMPKYDFSNETKLCTSYCDSLPKIANVKYDFMGLSYESYIGFFEKKHCPLFCMCINNATTASPTYKNICELE